MMNEVKSTPTLVYDVYAPQEEQSLPPIVIAHALLDCKKNWKGVASSLAEKTKRKVYVLDVPDFDDDDPPIDLKFNSTYKAVEEFIVKMDQPVVLIGHSIGAVIGILFATKQAQLVSQLVIIDISPTNYPSHAQGNLLQSLKIMRSALASLPKDVGYQQARTMIAKYTEKVIPSEVIRKMLLGNLMQGKNCIRWRIDLDAAEMEFRKNDVKNLYPLKCLCYSKCLLVFGELSDYVSENDFNEMKVVFPKLKLHCIKGATHWIHLEQPEKLTEVICDYLESEK